MAGAGGVSGAVTQMTMAGGQLATPVALATAQQLQQQIANQQQQQQQQVAAAAGAAQQLRVRVFLCSSIVRAYVEEEPL